MASIKKRNDKWRALVKVGELRDSNTFETQAKAKDWARIREIELKNLAGGTSSTHTMTDLFKRYSRTVSPKKRGCHWEQVRLEKFEDYPLAKIKLIDLTSDDLQDWIDARLKEVKSSTVNREMNLISNTLRWAKKWKWLKVIPTEDVERPKNPPHRDRRISGSEIEKLCHCLNYRPGVEITQKQQKVALALLFAIETGMRAGEICMLKPELIKAKVAHLPRTKNGYARDVPLSSKAREILKLLPDEKYFDHKNSDQMGQRFRTARIKAGIEDLTFHDSRHEAITRLASKFNVLELARIVGHRDIKQLMTYYNKSAEDLAEQLG